MPADTKRLTSFYVAIGADQVRHTRKTLLAHAIGVYRGLGEWGCSQDICRAGLFHSIYGTELFQRFKLPLERRDEIRQLIGEYAEKLAFINCFIDRASLDEQVKKARGPYRLSNRVTGNEIMLAQTEFYDLLRVHLYDHLEQVERAAQWDYRRAAYQAIAMRLGGVALKSYDAIFARETATA